MINIESAAKDGVDALLDLRDITDYFGFEGTFTYSRRYLDYESYIDFLR